MDAPDPYATATYDYDLPPELIAQTPAPQRDASRLLAVSADGSLRHLQFSDLLTLLHPGDLLVANDARVLKARFRPKRKRGGASQVLLLHPTQDPELWLAMARPGKRIRPGDKLTLGDGAGIEVVDWAPGGNRVVRFFGIDALTAMERFGEVPLPPYIRTAPSDAAERYQTVYATHTGSVAAPTAGLHFTQPLLARLKEAGIDWTTVTLDVGAGTFRPVTASDVREHVMHAEHYTIGAEAANAIARAREGRHRIVAVGTTALRALEDARRISDDGVIRAAERWTSLFVHPPEKVGAVDALITNFHLPRSTLLMLVCAFSGTRAVLAAYAEAVRQRYRFYSFGDAMFLERSEGQAGCRD
jgi:S-adenosylmethionine:tRNA ribosyltransferase-isomerase